jgi:Ti-type conjugative transfer relaxase TraA
MAVYSCSASVIGRASGRSAVASAAYRAGEKLTDDRQQLSWDFTQKRGVEHAEIVLSENAPAWASDRAALWNAAEAREDKSTRRDTAKVAREFRTALPHELDAAARLEITRAFSRYLVSRYGAAVDFAIHAPDRKGDDRNHHAHIMMTTRSLDADGLGAKIRVLDSPKTSGPELEIIRKEWADIQNAALAKAGSAARVDHRSLEAQGIDQEPTLHMGVAATAMERKGGSTERGDINREITARNAERDELKKQAAEVAAQIIDLDAERAKRADQKAIRSEAQTLDPDRILAAMTERRATFSRADLNRQLTEFLPDPKTRAAYTDEVLARADVIPLRENENAPVSRYTTRAVIADENRITDAAARLDKRTKHGLSATTLADTLDHHPRLIAEQRAALERATRAGGLAIIAGEAGTGKSATLGAIRDAYEAGGYDVRGLAHTNTVKEDLKADGFANASTIQAELMRQNNARGQKWNERTVLIVDEAAMVSSGQLAAILTKADTAGAKVILAGDDKQLASIERGGMFSTLTRDHGAAELHKVWRVKDEDSRAAFNAMHKGDFKTALATFDRQGALQWHQTPEETRAALVAQYLKDSEAAPDKKRFVFAYTNAEVHELNAAIRAGRKARGDLGEDHSLPTREGAQDFATGDRIQFTGNAANRAQKDAGLYNGAAGSVTAIDENRLTVTLDSAKDAPPRVVSFTVGANAEAGEFDAIRHGYAGTIYKGQGKTLDQTYLLHSDNWRAASGYVALSRHRESVKLFAAEKSEPWIMAEGGAGKLTEPQRAKAEQSFTAWTEAKPDLAKKYGFENYVAYVQAQWTDQKDLHRLDRMARQMGRTEENRAASQFTQGAPAAKADAPPIDDTPQRKRPLSIVAGIVHDYLELCYNPAKDWVKWIAEDLRGRAAARRADLTPTERTSDHADTDTESPRASMEHPDRIRGDALPTVRGGMDTDGGERRVVDGVPARPRASPTGHDGLRPLREAGGRITRPAATQAEAESATARLRKQLDGAAKETTKEDEPQKASDFLKGRGRFRDRGHDR